MRSGFIYVVGTAWGLPVKIGVAQDIGKRLATLQAGNPQSLSVFWESPECDDVYAVENHIHRSFGDKHVRGEWFEVEELSQITSAFDAFTGRKSRTKAAPTEETIASCKAVRAIIDRISLRAKISTDAAIDQFSVDHGLNRSTTWSFLYRSPVRVWASDYERIAKALWAECGKDFGLLTFVPEPDEMLEAIDVLNIRSIHEPLILPSKDRMENSKAHAARFERLTELVDALQALREEAGLPNEPDDKSTPRVED